MDQKRVSTTQTVVAGTYSEASRNTSTVGGKAGLGKSIDIVGGEICDDLELEFGGKREPARHCSLCQSPTAFYSVSKKTYLVCCCLSGAVHTPYSPHLGGNLLVPQASSVAISVASSLSLRRLCSPTRPSRALAAPTPSVVAYNPSTIY